MQENTVDDLGDTTSRRARVSERFSALNRRDVIKAGVFAGAAVALPAQRAVSA